MPLSSKDRQFLQTVERLKLMLIILAVAIFVFLLLSPPSELQLATSVIGVTLCGVFWLTQRLLSCITILDVELSRLVTTVLKSLPEEQRQQIFRQR